MDKGVHSSKVKNRDVSDVEARHNEESTLINTDNLSDGETADQGEGGENGSVENNRNLSSASECVPQSPSKILNFQKTSLQRLNQK